MTTIFYSESSNAGAAPSPAKQQIAPAALTSGQALMLTAAGHVANNGTAPISGFAPVGGVVAGATYTPQSARSAELPSAAFIVGTNYYLQPSGSIGATVTNYYAGTADSATHLSYQDAVAISASLPAGLAPAIDARLAAVTLGGAPDALDRQLLTEKTVYESLTATLLGAGTGTINVHVSAHFIVIESSDFVYHGTGQAAANFAVADLPPGIKAKGTNLIPTLNGASTIALFDGGYLYVQNSKIYSTAAFTLGLIKSFGITVARDNS